MQTKRTLVPKNKLSTVKVPVINSPISITPPPVTPTIAQLTLPSEELNRIVAPLPQVQPPAPPTARVDPALSKDQKVDAEIQAEAEAVAAVDEAKEKATTVLPGERETPGKSSRTVGKYGGTALPPGSKLSRPQLQPFASKAPRPKGSPDISFSRPNAAQRVLQAGSPENLIVPAPVASFTDASGKIYHPFTQSEMFLHNGSRRQKYVTRKASEKTSIHWGQRKLFLTEEFLLSRFPINQGQGERKDSGVVLYVGAADGEHIALLSTMFPELTFHLYDDNPSNPFKVQETDRIKIYQQYFLQPDAVQWANKVDYFICDIRTGSEDMPRDELEAKVMQDQSWQMEWCKTIKPRHALLKFRLPWTDRDHPNQQVPYLKGLVLWQPWGPQSTSETRLIPLRNSQTNEYEMCLYDAADYEDACFAHNLERESKLFVNPFTGDDKPIDPEGELVLDWDSRMEAQIHLEYLRLFGGPEAATQSNMLSLVYLLNLNINSKPGLRALREEARQGSGRPARRA